MQRRKEGGSECGTVMPARPSSPLFSLWAATKRGGAFPRRPLPCHRGCLPGGTIALAACKLPSPQDAAHVVVGPGTGLGPPQIQARLHLCCLPSGTGGRRRVPKNPARKLSLTGQLQPSPSRAPLGSPSACCGHKEPQGTVCAAGAGAGAGPGGRPGLEQAGQPAQVVRGAGGGQNGSGGGVKLACEGEQKGRGAAGGLAPALKRWHRSKGDPLQGGKGVSSPLKHPSHWTQQAPSRHGWTSRTAAASCTWPLGHSPVQVYSGVSPPLPSSRECA